MEQMNIESAAYSVDEFTSETTSITAVIDGVTMSVPLDLSNRHFAEITRQVEAGTLVIQEAE